MAGDSSSARRPRSGGGQTRAASASTDFWASAIAASGALPVVRTCDTWLSTICRTSAMLDSRPSTRAGMGEPLDARYPETQ